MTTESLLQFFGYHERWFTCGFVTEGLLRKQHAEWQASGDTAIEHYRYGAFRLWVQAQTGTSDKIIGAWLDLCKYDAVIGSSMLVDLLDVPWLTDAQFELVAQRAIGRGQAWLERRLVRASLMRRHCREPLSEELFEASLASGDKFLHEVLLKLPDVSAPQLEKLCHHGANKGIRNAAVARMRKA